jgi:hypothetical protein
VREYYRKNRARMCASSKAWYHRNRDDVLAAKKRKYIRRPRGRSIPKPYMRPPGYWRERYRKNRDRHRASASAYYHANKERLREKRNGQRRERRLKNPEQFKLWKKRDYERRKEKILSQQKARRAAFSPQERERYRAYMVENYAKNRAKRRAQAKDYNRRNLKKLNLARVIKRRTDVQFACRLRIRNRIRKILLRVPTDGGKSDYIELLGCPISEFIHYLESKFAPGMTWENRNEWHIDHKRPLRSFDLTDPVQHAAAFHYTNLQPLWALDNLRKGARWP